MDPAHTGRTGYPLADQGRRRCNGKRRGEGDVISLAVNSDGIDARADLDGTSLVEAARIDGRGKVLCDGLGIQCAPVYSGDGGEGNIRTVVEGRGPGLPAGDGPADLQGFHPGGGIRETGGGGPGRTGVEIVCAGLTDDRDGAIAGFVSVIAGGGIDQVLEPCDNRRQRGRGRSRDVVEIIGGGCAQFQPDTPRLAGDRCAGELDCIGIGRGVGRREGADVGVGGQGVAPRLADHGDRIVSGFERDVVVRIVDLSRQGRYDVRQRRRGGRVGYRTEMVGGVRPQLQPDAPDFAGRGRAGELDRFGIA